MPQYAAPNSKIEYTLFPKMITQVIKCLRKYDPAECNADYNPSMPERQSARR